MAPRSTPTPTALEFPGPRSLGCEWVVEARGCDPEALSDLPTLQGLFGRMIDELELNEVRPSVWHTFPGPGGITGMSLLAESHLTCHTFPEHGTLCLNLFCCTPRPEWDFAAGLEEWVGAERVDVRRIERRYVPEVPKTAPEPTVEVAGDGGSVHR